MTANQSRVLQYIEILRDAQLRDFQERKEQLLAVWPEARPSEFVFVEKLRPLCGRNLDRDLRSLAKQGRVEMKPSGGWGPQVKLIRG